MNRVSNRTGGVSGCGSDGLRQRTGEGLLECFVAVDLAPDVADDPTQPIVSANTTSSCFMLMIW